MPELRQHVLRHAEDVRIVGDVRLGEDGLAPHLRDALHHVARGRFAGDVIDGDVGAFFGEGEGDRAPDAAGPSGDEGGPTFEFHARFLPQASGQRPATKQKVYHAESCEA